MSITLDLSRVSNAPAVKAPVNLSGLTRAGLRQALIDADGQPIVARETRGGAAGPARTEAGGREPHVHSAIRQPVEAVR